MMNIPYLRHDAAEKDRHDEPADRASCSDQAQGQRASLNEPLPDDRDSRPKDNTAAYLRRAISILSAMSLSQRTHPRHHALHDEKLPVAGA
jgi:hypothetical protein